MKPILIAVLSVGMFTGLNAFGQEDTISQTQITLNPTTAKRAAQPSTPRVFTEFDLDFPGGPPAELVVAIEKATGKPLNAIIPPEHADVQLPPLKMRNVIASKLFEALQQSSIHQATVQTRSTYEGKLFYQNSIVSYGFKHAGNYMYDGDDTIWTFFVEGAPLPPPDPIACRYYQLEPYLKTYSIDDITTAIQTGWRMLGEKEVPELSFHKETKLLIAVGNPNELSLIDDVLKQLQPPAPKVEANPPSAAQPKPEEPK